MALCKKWSDRSQDDLDSAIDRALAKLGYLNRKKEQKEAARCVLQGKDVFVALPTGYGKSCIFQILPACSKLLLVLHTLLWALSTEIYRKYAQWPACRQGKAVLTV